MASAMRQRPVSRPRSSNRTCGFPASGFPTGFICKAHGGAQVHASKAQHAERTEDTDRRENRLVPRAAPCAADAGSARTRS